MDISQFKTASEAIQSQIFNEKLAQLRLKLDINRVKTQGYRHDLRTEQLKSQAKQVKTEIAEVELSIIQTDLKGIQSEAALNERKWMITLNGKSEELLALQESIQIRIATLRQKNLQAMSDLD